MGKPVARRIFARSEVHGIVRKIMPCSCLFLREVFPAFATRRLRLAPARGRLWYNAVGTGLARTLCFCTPAGSTAARGLATRR